MIELIFVIVVIGILASVAMPKFAGNRDNAVAAICLDEIGQFVSEISQAYVTTNFAAWSDENNTISNITNIRTNVTDGSGIETSGSVKIHATVVKYMCNGDTLLTFYPDLNGYEYKIDLEVQPVTIPAAVKASNLLIRKYGGNTKRFDL